MQEAVEARGHTCLPQELLLQEMCIRDRGMAGAALYGAKKTVKH